MESGVRSPFGGVWTPLHSCQVSDLLTYLIKKATRAKCIKKCNQELFSPRTISPIVCETSLQSTLIKSEIICAVVSRGISGNAKRW